jgi:ATP-binding cassette subfamily B protein
MAADSSLPKSHRWRTRGRTAWAAADAVWAGSPLLLGGMAAVSVLSGLISPVTAWLQRDVLDTLAGSGRPVSIGEHGVLWLVIALGAGGIAASVVPQLQQYVQAQLRRAAGVVVTDRAYKAVSSWPGMSRFESPAFADKLQLVSQLAQVTASSLISSSLGLIQSGITSVSFAITLLLMNPVLAAVTVGIQSLAIAADLVNARSQAQLRVENSARARRQNSFATLMSDPIAAKEVRLFGLGAFLRGRMLDEMRAANDAERTLARRLLTIESGLSALSATVIGGGLVWIVAQIGAHRLPVGDVSLFVLAALGLQGAMSQIASSGGSIAQSVSLFTAYTDVIYAEPDLPVATRQAPPLKDGITVDNVWFRYDESHPWALSGLSMFIPAGRRTAIVGLNGAGKSTLIKLLCRLYDPVKGAIRWDDIDLRELDPISLRTRIAPLFQDFVSYEMTARENIGLGDLPAIDDFDLIKRAAELAGSDADLARLPDGYDTLLSRIFRQVPKKVATGPLRPGVLLSGGQRQRMALARALMRADCDLFLVDEPMSSLDAEAEYAMNHVLDGVSAHGSTSVLISHRLASVRSADQIIVIANGIVAERGTHMELMAADGHYARLFKLQASGYSDVGAANGATVPHAEG